MWGVTAGNMDSMVNRYTADRRLRHDDAYTPGGEGGRRPDRAVVVYAQRCREAFPDVPIVLGGIEASLRRIAHYDYWSDKVRRSVLLDAKADLLVYGNGERAIVEIAHRLARRARPPETIRDLRGTAFSRPTGAPPEGWTEIDSREVDTPGAPAPRIDPYADTTARGQGGGAAPARLAERAGGRRGAGGGVARAGAQDRSRPHGGSSARRRRGDGRPDPLRPRLAPPARRVQPRERPRAGPAARRSRRLVQPAAAAAVDAGDGPALRVPLHAPPAPLATATPRSPPTT